MWWFPRAAVMNYYKLDDLKQQKCILSQSWRPEVQNQGVGRAMFSLRDVGKDPSSPLPASRGSGQFLAFLASL